MKASGTKITTMAILLFLLLNVFLYLAKTDESKMEIGQEYRMDVHFQPVPDVKTQVNEVKKLNSKEVELHIALKRFLLEQENRKAEVKKVCKKRRINILPPPPGQTRFIFDPKNKIGYCPIYKSASTSITELLTEIQGVDAPNPLPLKDLAKYFTVEFITYSTSMKYENVTKFIVVRNPIERLISAYRDKLERANSLFYYNHYGKKILLKQRFVSPLLSQEEKSRMLNEVTMALEKGGNGSSLADNVYAKPFGPTFQEFVKYLVTDPLLDEHWRPFYLHCGLCVMDFDYILKFESLGSEMKDFLRLLNQSHVNMTWENANHEGRTDTVICKYLATISRQDFRNLVLMYVNDLRLFGYDYKHYLNCFKDLT